ncbi:hypothetical protein JCM17092_33950 [Haloplanus litoreus]
MVESFQQHEEGDTDDDVRNGKDDPVKDSLVKAKVRKWLSNPFGREIQLMYGVRDFHQHDAKEAPDDEAAIRYLAG